MKLLPPPEPTTEVESPPRLAETEAGVAALRRLNQTSEAFFDRLDSTMDRFERLHSVGPVIALTAFLEGSSSMLRTLIADYQNVDVQNAREGRDDDTGGGRATSRGNGNLGGELRRGPGRPRKIVLDTRAVAEAPPKRKRGRPKGSKNKTKPSAQTRNDLRVALRKSASLAKQQKGARRITRQKLAPRRRVTRAARVRLTKRHERRVS